MWNVLVYSMWPLTYAPSGHQLRGPTWPAASHFKVVRGWLSQHLFTPLLRKGRSPGLDHLSPLNRQRRPSWMPSRRWRPLYCPVSRGTELRFDRCPWCRPGWPGPGFPFPTIPWRALPFMRRRGVAPSCRSFSHTHAHNLVPSAVDCLIQCVDKSRGLEDKNQSRGSSVATLDLQNSYWHVPIISTLETPSISLQSHFLRPWRNCFLSPS